MRKEAPDPENDISGCVATRLMTPPRGATFPSSKLADYCACQSAHLS